jgi:hypothetical protein
LPAIGRGVNAANWSNSSCATSPGSSPESGLKTTVSPGGSQMPKARLNLPWWVHSTAFVPAAGRVTVGSRSAWSEARSPASSSNYDEPVGSQLSCTDAPTLTMAASAIW